MTSRGVFSTQNTFRDNCFSFVKCVSGVTVGGGSGGLGSSPKKIFGLNGVKSCNVSKINMEMALSLKPGIVCMTGEGIILGTWK